MEEKTLREELEQSVEKLHKNVTGLALAALELSKEDGALLKDQEAMANLKKSYPTMYSQFTVRIGAAVKNFAAGNPSFVLSEKTPYGVMISIGRYILTTQYSAAYKKLLVEINGYLNDYIKSEAFYMIFKNTPETASSIKRIHDKYMPEITHAIIAGMNVDALDEVISKMKDETSTLWIMSYQEKTQPIV